MGLLILLGLIVLLSPLVAAVAAFTRTQRLEDRLAGLDRRLERMQAAQDELRRQLRARGAGDAAPSEPETAPSPRPAESDAAAEAPAPADAERSADAEFPAADAGTTSVPPVPPLPPAARPQPARASMEESIGSRWSVWLGALALGLGAMFLVKHSIDQGYLTPGVRVLLGALLAALLLAGGEWLRRHDLRAAIAGLPGAHVPGALTAGGIVAAFATVYAAYALYGFIDPLLAFLLLAAVSVAALVLSALHGPTLAAMGLVGSYATPALVSTEHPSAWSLFTYLLFVTLAVFVTAQARGWLWLAISGLVGSVAWGFLWCVASWQPGDVVATSVYVAGLSLLALVFLKQAEPRRVRPQDDRVLTTLWLADLPVSLGLGAIGLVAAVMLRYDDYQFGSWATFVMLTGFLLAVAWLWRSMTLTALLAALLFGFAYGTWHFGWLIDRGPTLDAVTPPALAAFLDFGLLFAAAFGLVGYLGALRRNGEPVWALVSAATPLAAFAYAYWRATWFEHSLPFGFAGLALTGLLVVAADRLDRAGTGRRQVVSAGLYATAAVGALALSLTMMLEKGWLTVALAAVTPLIAVIAARRDMPVLRGLAAAMALVVAGRFVYDPRIVGEALGTTPVFNWLLYGYGLPTLAFAAAAHLFRKERDGFVPGLMEATAILFGATLIFLEIRHYMNAGDVFSSRFDLPEVSLHSAVWLSLALAYQWAFDRGGRLLPNLAAALFGALGLLSVLIGHLLTWNPLLTGRGVGSGILFNDLLLAYLFPALLCALLYRLALANRPLFYQRLLAFAAFVLPFAWLSLEVRSLYQDGWLGLLRATSDAEWYTYSAVWLGYGLALLGAGILFGQQALRQAGLVLVGLTVVKVFLSDMADLTGVLRALSFIGLGLALVGIGWLYQRLVFPQQPPQAPADDPTSA